MIDFVCGANEEDFNLAGVNWGRDLPSRISDRLRNVVPGDSVATARGCWAIQRGIEVGHVFARAA